jgi:Txe/YoeB family toxin of Txe-Axe toxin-antitoxin module
VSPENFVFNSDGVWEQFIEAGDMAGGTYGSRFAGRIIGAAKAGTNGIVSISLPNGNVAHVSFGKAASGKIFIKSVDIVTPQAPAPRYNYTILNEEAVRALIEKEYGRGEEANKNKALDLLETLKQHGTNKGDWYTNGDGLHELEGKNSEWTLKISGEHRLAFTINGNNIKITDVKGHYPPEKK